MIEPEIYERAIDDRLALAGYMSYLPIIAADEVRTLWESPPPVLADYTRAWLQWSLFE